MTLAEAMNDWEEQRAETGASPQAWLADLAARLDAPGIADGREAEPLRYWLELHYPEPRHPPLSRSKAQRRWDVLPACTNRPPTAARSVPVPACAGSTACT